MLFVLPLFIIILSGVDVVLLMMPTVQTLPIILLLLH